MSALRSVLAVLVLFSVEACSCTASGPSACLLQNPALRPRDPYHRPGVVSKIARRTALGRSKLVLHDVVLRLCLNQMLVIARGVVAAPTCSGPYTARLVIGGLVCRGRGKDVHDDSRMAGAFSSRCNRTRLGCLTVSKAAYRRASLTCFGKCMSTIRAISRTNPSHQILSCLSCLSSAPMSA